MKYHHFVWVCIPSAGWEDDFWFCISSGGIVLILWVDSTFMLCTTSSSFNQAFPFSISSLNPFLKGIAFWKCHKETFSYDLAIYLDVNHRAILLPCTHIPPHQSQDIPEQSRSANFLVGIVISQLVIDMATYLCAWLSWIFSASRNVFYIWRRN